MGNFQTDQFRFDLIPLLFFISGGTMNKKLLIPILFLFTLILAISSVSAAENSTDTVNAENFLDDEKQTLSDEDLSQVTETNGGEILGENSTPPMEKSKSSVSASSVSGYSSFPTKFVVKLKINNKPAAGKKIIINVNKNNYTRYTNNNGEAIMNINLQKGIYNVNFVYAGDVNTTSSKGTSKITVKQSLKTNLITDNYLNFRQGLKSIFYVKLYTQKGVLKNQLVIFTVAGKTYKVKTNSIGYAKIYLSLKKGTYKIRATFTKNKPYLGCSKVFTIKVKPQMAKGNGYWLWPMHMSSINLKTLANRGTKHIFLLSDAVHSYGMSYVTSWIKKANSYGMSVHIWMMVCYNGDWVSPVRDDGSFKYYFINKKINEAKYYAKIKGVAGIHLDYMRYGGTAHKHINSIESINYIVKKISYAVHSVNPNAIMSIAIMPEPSMMHYYYGQDVPTLSKYVDALLPMAYKGSYGQNTKWIQSVTKTFVKQSNGAQIWTGLQTYKSEEDTSKLPYNALMIDARSAMKGGAAGVVLFRVGITYYLNFRNV